MSTFSVHIIISTSSVALSSSGSSWKTVVNFFILTRFFLFFIFTIIIGCVGRGRGGGSRKAESGGEKRRQREGEECVWLKKKENIDSTATVSTRKFPEKHAACQERPGLLQHAPNTLGDTCMRPFHFKLKYVC